MFDFEKLEVYRKARMYNNLALEFIENNKKLGRPVIDQLQRASFSISLNIAEGSGRQGKADRANFLVIARGSLFECVAIYDLIYDRVRIDEVTFRKQYEIAEDISRMLVVMVRNLRQEREPA